MTTFRRILRNKRAAALAEYGLLAGLVGIVTLVSVARLGYEGERVFDGATVALMTNLRKPESPDILAFTQAGNGSEIRVAYANGKNYRDCRIEYDGGSGWQELQSVDCQAMDEDVSLQFAELPDPWSSVPLRLTAFAGQWVLADLGSATCSPIPASLVSTPTVDENCNGRWNEPLRVQETYTNPVLANNSRNYPIHADLASRFCATRGYDWTIDPEVPVDSVFQVNTAHISAISASRATTVSTGSAYLIRNVTCLRPDYFG